MNYINYISTFVNLVAYLVTSKEYEESYLELGKFYEIPGDIESITKIVYRLS